MAGVRSGVGALILLFSLPIMAERDDESERGERLPDRYEVCQDELGRPDSWLDRSHSYLTQRLCEPAAWFDGFFGDPRSLEETPVGTFFSDSQRTSVG